MKQKISFEYQSSSEFNSAFKKINANKSKNIIQITRVATPLGLILAGSVKNKICFLEFTDKKIFEIQLKKISKIFNAVPVPGNNKIFHKLKIQLDEYFKGARKKFDIPVQIDGTNFQKKVWYSLKEIPYGSTASYKKLAEKIGKPKAVRAVGKANGDNRISIIIPCHRVIGSNGSLVNYGGGIWRKHFLLDLEKENS